jgi:CHAT domain-containing protein
LKSGNWDSISFAKFCVNYGNFAFEHGNYTKAEKLLNLALDLTQPKLGKYNLNTSVTLNALGNLYLKTKDYDKAVESYQSAISSTLKAFNSTSLYSNPALSEVTANVNLLNPLKGKAKALQMKYRYVSSDTSDLSASLNTYACAINAIEKLRLLYGNTESSTALSSNENDVYDGAVETAVLLYKKTNNEKYFSQAFTFAEKSKAASLLSAVRSNDAMVAAKVPTEIQDIERNLRKKANQYKYLITQESTEKQPSDTHINLWNAKLDTLQKQHEVLMNYISKNFPEYYNLGFNTNVLSCDSVKKKLNANEAFIEYVCTTDNIYAFAMTKQTRKIISIESDSTFQDNLAQYQNSISVNDSKSGGDHSNFITSASSLYSTLIKPFESIIKNKSLIIIPDEELYNVPFECLLTKDVDRESKFNSLPYLIRESAISYAGSATLLYGTKSTVTSNTDKLLAFAPSYESTGNISDTSEATRSLMKSITPLLGTKEEVKNIGEIMGGDVYEGKNATLQNFKSNYSGYDILHLAMHTMIDDEDPMNSKLVFGADKNSNGVLNTYELYSMKLDAKLAVLSACNTGKGKMLKGEGMLCLARGFLYAGCPSLVMTLWEINDRTGSKLMQNFYTYLSQGKSKDEALRLSKLDYLSISDDLQANPYYWAGYINFGNHEPIISITDKDVKHKSYAIPAALLIFAAASLFFLKKRKLFSRT